MQRLIEQSAVQRSYRTVRVPIAFTSRYDSLRYSRNPVILEPGCTEVSDARISSDRTGPCVDLPHQIALYRTNLAIPRTQPRGTEDNSADQEETVTLLPTGQMARTKPTYVIQSSLDRTRHVGLKRYGPSNVATVQACYGAKMRCKENRRGEEFTRACNHHCLRLVSVSPLTECKLPQPMDNATVTSPCDTDRV